MLLKNIFSLLVILGVLTSCFEDEIDPQTSKNTPLTDPEQQGINIYDPDFLNSDFGFPLDPNFELTALERLRKSECIGNIDCSMSDVDRLADDFTFKSGKLILRGNLVKLNTQTNQWMIDSQLEVISSAVKNETLLSQQESEIHKFTSELQPYFQLVSGINMNLDQPIKPVTLTQEKLGLKDREPGDPGLCNILAAENFEKNSLPPWPKYDHSQILPSTKYTWPQGTGMFNENNDLFAAETLVVCGEIILLNRTVKLEAKNIIFYNSHIKIRSDRDMPAGLRVTAENIGYFGANIIESNMLNRVSGQKNAYAPTIDLSVSGIVTFVPSPVPINNKSNAHFMKIFMAEHN